MCLFWSRRSDWFSVILSYCFLFRCCQQCWCQYPDKLVGHKQTYRRNGLFATNVGQKESGMKQTFAYRGMANHANHRLPVYGKHQGIVFSHLAGEQASLPTGWNSTHFRRSRSKHLPLLYLSLRPRRLPTRRQCWLCTACTCEFPRLWRRRGVHLGNCRTAQRPPKTSLLEATSSNGLPASPSRPGKMMTSTWHLGWRWAWKRNWAQNLYKLAYLRNGRTTNYKQGKIVLLSLWTVKRLSFVIWSCYLYKGGDSCPIHLPQCSTTGGRCFGRRCIRCGRHLFNSQRITCIFSPL